MEKYKQEPLKDNVLEMFIGPFGSSLKNDCFVDEEDGFCMVYEQKHAIQKTMDVETRYVNEKKYNELKRFNVRGGDIIVSCRGTIGETFIVPDDAPLGVMHPSIMKIRLKDGVYNKCFFNDLLYTRLKKHEAEANGSGVKMAISANKLGEELFPVPSIQQQEEIIQKITLIRKLIDQRKTELLALDELIKARFVEMFGTINDNKYGYDVKTLQEVCEQIKDGTHQTPEYTEDKENGFKFLSSKDVTSGKIDWSNIKYIPESLHNELYARIAPKKGDLLLAKNGTTGVAAVVDCDEVFDIYVSLALLRPINIDSIYLWAAVNSAETKHQFDGSLKGIGVPNLHLGEIKKTMILVPPMEKQKDFDIFLEQVDKSKFAIQKSLEKTQLLFDSLMQKYFG